MDNQNIVFVYGTLKFGFYNHDLLEYSTFLGEGITVNKYPMYSGGYFPFLVEQEGEGNKVYGELYSVDDETMQDLDYLEGVPMLYYRKQIEIKNTETEENHTAWVYFQADPPEDLLKYELISEFL